MASCEGYTILQINGSQCQNSSQRSWTAVALFAIIGFSAALTMQASLQLYQRTTTSDSTRLKEVQLRAPALSRVAPSAFLVAQAQREDRVYVPQQSQSSQATTLLGGIFIFVGAAFAFIHKFSAPKKQEAFTLLPVIGSKESSGNAEQDLHEIFTFNNLRAAPGSRHRKKRKGRGYAAGQGGTCGFGTDGQKARKGRAVRPGFEGGQTTLWRRTPKLRGRPLGPGHPRKSYQLVRLTKLAAAAQGSTVQFDDLSGGKPVLFKVGGLKAHESVNLPTGLTVKAHAFTGSARAAIEAAGGKCIVIDKYSRELDAEGKVVGAAEKVAMVAFCGEVAVYNESDAEEDTDMFISDDESDAMSDAGNGDIAMFATMAVRSAKVGKFKEPKPLSSKMSPQKKAIIDQVHEALKGSFLVFGFSMQGITMAQISALRKSIPAGCKIQVVKNTLFRMASRNTGFEALDPVTMGSKAWVFIPEPCFQEAVKTYSAFVRDAKKQDTNPIVGGAVEAKFLTEVQVNSLVDVPTKKESIEKIARLLKGIPQKIAMSIKATPRKVAVAIRLATYGDTDPTKATA